MSRSDRLLLGLRVIVLALVVVNVPVLRSPEAERMREIESTPGRAYRDFALEYPVGDLPVIRLVGSRSAGGARVVLALIAFGADLVAFGALRRGWGRIVGTRYLLYGAPLLVFIYRRSDLVSMALVVLALALVRKDRERAGGLALGAAALVKLWPLVLLPALILDRRLRSLGAFTATFVAGLAAWVLVGGPRGPWQVMSFRGATGWELGSSVGAVVWALTGTYRFEVGANRSGLMPGWSRVALLAILLAGLAAIWVRAKDRDVDPAGAPALAAVALLLVVSPVLSPQYLCWLVPWAAIAVADVRCVGRVALVPIWLTGLVMAAWFSGVTNGHTEWSQAVLIARNLSLAAVPAAWLWFARPHGPLPASARRTTMVPS